MQYRKFGKLDWQVSALGFGTMRLPLKSADMADVDEDEAIRMIRYAIDHGVNYVDTAHPYHMGKSERVVGRALKGGYRQKVKLATKLTGWEIQTASDFDRFLDEQFESLQVDKIDFYLLHGLTKELWHKLRDLGVLKWAEGVMARGRIDYLGFSFHDVYDVFQEIVDYYDNWTFCQVMYNYIDIENQAGRRGVEYATSKDLAVVVMEPLRGGRLTSEPPPQVAEVWRSAPKKRSLADWGLSWLWNQPEISVVLSGMSTMEQVVENVAIAERSGPGTLTADEVALVDRAGKAYLDQIPIPCTSCGYCLPCPNGIEIPMIFRTYNDAVMFNDIESGRRFYRGRPPGSGERKLAGDCLECEQCLELCPQHIDIPEWMKKIHETLGSGT